MDSIWASFAARALEYEDDFVRLLCFSVQSLRRTSGLLWWAWIASGRRVWLRVWGWRADFGRGSRKKEESVETRSKESSHGCSGELVALYSTLQVLLYQWLIPCFISRWCRDDSGSVRKWGSVDWRGDWWAVEGVSHCCYQEPGTVSWGAPAWCPLGSPQSRSKQGAVRAGIWRW